MHYVMAHESDEVKKETQALMGATRLEAAEKSTFSKNRVAFC